MKRVAIVQSNYIPWKGYFDLIGSVDEFVLYDHVQYTKNDWRNRNKIKTPSGLIWLTIPVKSNYLQKINETITTDSCWISSHLKSIEYNYKKAANFTTVFPELERIYKEASSLNYLSDINALFINEVNNLLSIKTKITDSRKYKTEGTKTDALIYLLKQIDDSPTYLSGLAAKSYLDESLMNKNGITVEWMDYSDYREYKQLYPPFEHKVSIVDLLLNEGPDARAFMKS